MRILNFGFFHLDDTYVEALKGLKNHEGAPVCSEDAFEDLRTRTFLPIIDNVSSPFEVFSLVKAACDVAKPEKGDLLIVSGTPDVINYVVDLVRGKGPRIICPLGKIRGGQFNLFGFREIVTEAAADEERLSKAIFCLIEKDV